MTVIRPNSISGITSITSHQNDVAFYKSDGSGANINNISIHSPSGIITSANFKNASTDVHSIGIDVGSNIKIGTGGIITATSYRGDGSQLTGITAGTSLTGSTNNTVCTVTGANAIQGESNVQIDSNGRLLIGTTIEGNGNADELTISYNNTGVSGGDQGRCGMTIRSGDNTSGVTQNGYIYFSDGTSGTNESVGAVVYEHDTDSMYFATNQVANLRIDVNGNINVTGFATATAFVSDFQPRNMIINGAMQINARANGTLTINSSTGQYPCDRWVSRGESSSKQFTIQKTSIASSGRGVRNSLKVTSSQAASVGSNDIYNVRQKIEGFNIQRLNLGEAGCASMALSFTVRSSVAGTHSGAIQNESQNRSYPFTYTLAENTWKDVKIIIPPITSGSFNEGTGTGLILVFDLGCGNNFRGTAGQWNSAQDEGATGAVRILETNGATWEISKVQLEEGTVCTPFEKRMVTQETILCERYYQRYGAQRHNWMTNVNGTDHRKMVYFSTTMRTSPTMNLYDQSVDGSSVSAQYVTPNGYVCRLNGNGRHAAWKHEADAEI